MAPQQPERVTGPDDRNSAENRDTMSDRNPPGSEDGPATGTQEQAAAQPRPGEQPHAGLPTVLREWGRIGCIGFGGPPTHIALLRDLCVARKRWLDAKEFEDAVAACNLLPGPASTQLAIFCAWRVRGRLGALAGGAAFIVPGLITIIALAALFLAGSPPSWVRGAGGGAGAAVAAVAVQAAARLVPASWRRPGGSRIRWAAYLGAGLAAAATLGLWLVVVLVTCGLAELGAQRAARARAKDASAGVTVLLPLRVAAGFSTGVLSSLAWVAIKVGMLSFGGGFVIVPLMQADAVGRYHWMSGGQFLNAVALGQITPGPVVQTVAVVGYAAAGVGGSLLAAAIAFAPSFVFVLAGGRHFERLRTDTRAAAFLGGAGPAAIGAIFGSAIPLARALTQPWQYAVLAGAAVLLLALRRGVVFTVACAGLAGTIVALAGGPAAASMILACFPPHLARETRQDHGNGARAVAAIGHVRMLHGHGSVSRHSRCRAR